MQANQEGRYELRRQGGPGLILELPTVVYLVVIALSKMLFEPDSLFWRSIPFSQRLFCIAVDKAHLIWGWREFCKNYSNIGILQAIYPKIPIMALSATLTPTTLEHVRKALDSQSPVRLHERPLNCPKMIYTVAQIGKRGFHDLGFLVPETRSISAIPKIMIFVDSIRKVLLWVYSSKGYFRKICELRLSICFWPTWNLELKPNGLKTFWMEIQKYWYALTRPA